MAEQVISIPQALELGIREMRARRYPQAEEVYRKILAVQPKNPDAVHMLGVIAMEVGRNDIALQLIAQAIAIEPNISDYHGNLGLAQLRCGRVDEALKSLRAALLLRPEYPEALHNLGNALEKKHQWREAVASYRKALDLKPDFPEALADMGASLHDLAEFDQAISAYRKALELEPKLSRAHLNLGIVLLLKGDLRRGFEHYDWRWSVSELALHPRAFTQPLWDGSKLNGKRILIHPEQGLGDVIQMIRYAPRVAERGGVVWLECKPELRRLLHHFPGVARLVDRDEASDFDVHCPIMSLPRRFDTTLKNIPAEVPYLRADPALVEKWRARVPTDRRLKVGLVWAGSPVHYNDFRRSMQLKKLAPLAEVKDIWLCSLQKGAAAFQAQTPPTGLNLTDFTEELTDLADTAALMENMDLILSVDTSAVHLAGALGKSVWMMMPYVPDWRWLLNRADSPWYPTLKLFRQEVMDDWNGPIGRVVEELKKR